MSTAHPSDRASISVIIPTHNRSKYLPQALASVLSQAGADLPLETIVIDDCSTDDTPLVLASYGDRIRTLRLATNRGAGAAQNEGLKLASGKYVKFFDSDDVLCEGTLRDELSLAEATSADMVLSGWGYVSIDEHLETVPGSQRVLSPPNMNPLPDSVLAGLAAPTSAVLYRRSYIDGLWWEPKIRCPDDWHFFCQAALRYGKIARRDAQAYWLRDHAGPRASIAGMLTYAHGHHAVLQYIEQTLSDQNLLTPQRKGQLAQYYYKQIYVLAMYDAEAFDRASAHILELDPAFQPTIHERKAYMRLLARWFGFRRAVRLHATARRWLRGSTAALNTAPAATGVS